MATITAFLGMRGNGDWATDERPKNWRQGILRLYPNGMAPLTAILSKMSEEKVDDPEFNWWTKALPTQGGTVTNVYSDVAMSTAIATAQTSGTTVYAKVAEAVADEFRVGHQALLRVSTDPAADVNCEVTGVTKNGASSCITCKLLEADDNSTSHNISDTDTILIIGNINAEGGSMPDAIAYKPTKLYNYTQIFRNALSQSRTAQKTRLRTADAYKEGKRETLELHSIEMEKAFIFGEKTEGTGANGKPKRTTQGLIPCIRENSSDNVVDFTLDTDSDYVGQTWVDAGEAWLDEKLEVLFRYGSQEKLAFCGSGALLGINKLVKASGNFEYTAKTAAYGIKVVEWVTAFGTLYLKTHPLFSYNAVDRNTLLIVEPKLLKYRFVDDTHFIPDKSSGSGRIDGKVEEFLTEAGLEFQFPEAFGLFTGIGKDNELA